MQTQKLKPEEQQVVNKAQQLEDLVKDASNWASNHLKDAQIQKFMDRVLQEKQVTVSRIKESARRPLALGVFGASQCGKSYLVSELVRGANPSLGVYLNRPGEQAVLRDYLEEINPPGGRESTAVVTRFTTRPYFKVPGCAAFIKLMGIGDLVKIFLNGFVFECVSDFMPSAEELQKLRYSFRSYMGKSHNTPLLSEADVMDLQDYARRHFHNQFLRMLDDLNYWGILNEEVRFLPADQQIMYLEWLWGKFPRITELFRYLQKELGDLGGQIVGIYDEALCPRENSIIDVQRLSALMKPGNRKYRIVTADKRETAMDAVVLCALTSELILQVQPLGDNALLNKLDILDFPGARARAQVFDANRVSRDQESLVEVFLRGKVACLFDGYSDDRDITALMLCQEGGPQEAKSLPYMINKWIEWSQGGEASARKGKKCLLFHVFTKFDMDLVKKRGEDPMVRWDSRLKTNFSDFFSRGGDWVNNWSEDRSFQNCFWVRNPSVQQTVFGRDQNNEEFVRDQEQISQIKSEYLSNANVKKYFANPELAWDRAASPGQSGIKYLVEAIEQTIESTAKTTQLAENLSQIHIDLKNNLEPYFIGDDVSKARNLAEKRARRCLASLGKVMASKYSLPLLLDQDRLSISDKTVGMIYDSVLNPMYSDNDQLEQPALVQAGSPLFEESIFQIDDESNKDEPRTEQHPKKVVSKGHLFAQAVLDRWQSQLAQLGQDQDFQTLTGLNAEWFATISQEIIKGASRTRLEHKIAAISDQYLNAPGSSRFLRKTSAITASMINRYVLELNQQPSEKQLPLGPPKVTLSARAYPGLTTYQHWTNSLITMFKDNIAEASAEDEVSNKVLEKILKAQI